MNVSSISIVGGGTSAWLAAAYLSKNLSNVEITVIDKEFGTPIGVGEATLLSFEPFMKECGFNIEDWFVPLDTGYKSGILFSNWRTKGDEIWHPFNKGNKNLLDNLNTWDSWSCNQDLDFKKIALTLYETSVLHNKIDIDHSNYAYHIDCGKLVNFLQKNLKNKIKIIKSDVTKVNYRDEINIASIDLKNGAKISSDLYIDCTGFNNILRKPTRKIDLSDRLFVNTAVACPIPYKDRANEFKPYAVCEAVDHGWIWKIGVSSRIGSGMVFNRHITDIEEAKKYFVNHWDHRIQQENVRAIHWDPFYIQDQWVGNVVAIGLSAGFIEPLESTGVALITYAIGQLNNSIIERRFTAGDRDHWNNLMNLIFEDCVDFVAMHYANNTRSTKFWNWVTSKFKTTSRMDHFIKELSDPLVSMPMKGRFSYMFGGGNWSLMLTQLGFNVASRDILINKEYAAELLRKQYIENEKNRHVVSRQHAAEIDRITELNKLWTK